MKQVLVEVASKEVGNPVAEQVACSTPKDCPVEASIDDMGEVARVNTVEVCPVGAVRTVNTCEVGQVEASSDQISYVESVDASANSNVDFNPADVFGEAPNYLDTVNTVVGYNVQKPIVFKSIGSAGTGLKLSPMKLRTIRKRLFNSPALKRLTKQPARKAAECNSIAAAAEKRDETPLTQAAKRNRRYQSKIVAPSEIEKLTLALGKEKLDKNEMEIRGKPFCQNQVGIIMKQMPVEMSAKLTSKCQGSVKIQKASEYVGKRNRNTLDKM